MGSALGERAEVPPEAELEELLAASKKVSVCARARVCVCVCVCVCACV